MGNFEVEMNLSGRPWWAYLAPKIEKQDREENKTATEKVIFFNFF